MAWSAPSVISTKPKPRDRPVSRSVTTWARVTVKLKTHSENGITDRDFALARRLDEVVLWRPAEGAALEGTPNKFVMSGKAGS